MTPINKMRAMSLMTGVTALNFRVMSMLRRLIISRSECFGSMVIVVCLGGWIASVDERIFIVMATRNTELRRTIYKLQ